MMVMMCVRLGTLGSTKRCQPAVAVLVTLSIIILGLPPLAFASGLCWCVGINIVHQIDIITATDCRVVRKRQLCSRGDRTRAANAANAASYARKHATKLTLNARLTSRTLELWLRTLDSLGQWRQAAFPVDLVDLKKPSWLAGYARTLFHLSRSSIK